MMAPASETAIRSATLTGNSENATAALPESTSVSSSAVPRAPPTKSMRLSVRDVRDAENRREQLLLQHADVERRESRRSRRRLRRAAAASASAPPKYIAISPRCAGAAGPALDVEPLAHGRQERVRRQPAEILDDPVVRQDLHLVVRKRHGEKRVVVGAVAERRPRHGQSRIASRARAALAAR